MFEWPYFQKMIYLIEDLCPKLKLKLLIQEEMFPKISPKIACNVFFLEPIQSPCLVHKRSIVRLSAWRGGPRLCQADCERDLPYR